MLGALMARVCCCTKLIQSYFSPKGKNMHNRLVVEGCLLLGECRGLPVTSVASR